MRRSLPTRQEETPSPSPEVEERVGETVETELEDQVDETVEATLDERVDETVEERITREMEGRDQRLRATGASPGRQPREDAGNRDPEDQAPEAGS